MRRGHSAGPLIIFVILGLCIVSGISLSQGSEMPQHGTSQLPSTAGQGPAIIGSPGDDTRTVGKSVFDRTDTEATSEIRTEENRDSTELNQGSQLTRVEAEVAVKHGTPTEHSSDEKIRSLTDQLSQLRDWGDWLEKAILLLTAAILLASLVNGWVVLQILRMARSWEDRIETRSQLHEERIREDGRRLEERLKSVRQEVGDQVNLVIGKKLEKKLNELSRQAQDRIVAYLEEDFTEPLERRYLSTEYVRNGIWVQVSSRMNDAIARNDHVEVTQLWNRFFKGQVALRQLLSAEEKDVFTGLCSLRVFARQGFVPKDSLWKLVILLKEQGRLNWENVDMARRLGRDIGRRFGGRDNGKTAKEPCRDV